MTSDPYRNGELFRFVGSMEGVPEWSDPAEGAARSGARARGYALLELAGRHAPGLLLALGIAALASAAPHSPILLAILAGLLIRNTVGLPPAYAPGVRLGAGGILRVGVALLGLRLNLGALTGLGLIALPIVVACIATALLLAAWIDARVRSAASPRHR